jgi:hypothetical protein
MYNGYYDNDNFDAAKFLDEQLGPALTKKGSVRKIGSETEVQV